MSAVSVICLVFALLVLILPIACIIKGAVDRRRAVRPVTYYPPRGASPIDVMLKYSGKSADSRDIFSAIMLYWASRGFVTIEEDCKRGLKLTKLKDIEPPEQGAFDADTFKDECELFNGLFADGEVFYTLAAESSYDKCYESFTAGCECNAERVPSKLSQRLYISCTALAIALLAVVTVILGIANNSAGYFAGIFPFAGVLVLRFARDELAKHGTAAQYMMYPFFTLWSGLPGMAVIFMSTWDSGVAYAVSLVVCIVVLFFLSRMIDIRSAEDLKYYGEIDAFKTFLVQAEKDRLETLIEQDPEYFYNVLPYFYVLGISEKMKKKFDRIVMDGPSWYLGELRDTLMF